jgi:hypothetical protein
MNEALYRKPWPRLGIIGAVIVWRGLKKSEVPATWMGVLGASLIWIGWFEFSFGYFANLYAVPPYEVDAMYSAILSANMLQATLPPAFAIFLLGLYQEIWLQPFGYPVSSLIALMIFVAGFIYVAQKNPVRPRIS